MKPVSVPIMSLRGVICNPITFWTPSDFMISSRRPLTNEEGKDGNTSFILRPMTVSLFTPVIFSAARLKIKTLPDRSIVNKPLGRLSMTSLLKNSRSRKFVSFSSSFCVVFSSLDER
jgi:hypothetical protein